MQFSAFFLFSNFRKGRLLYIHPVGRLVDVTINFSICNSLPFFYFLTFKKADCSIFTLSVGWSVGRSVDVTINFFNIYRHKSPLLTQYHSIPISTKLFWPSTIKYQPVLPCKGPVLSYIMMSIVTMSIDHNLNKRFALFTWSSFNTST